MKNIINIFLIGMAITFTACEPIDDSKELGVLLTSEQIDATIENTTPGGNKLVFKCNETKMGGYWDYISGTTHDYEFEIVYPYVGDFTFAWYATSAGGVVKKEINVKIDKIDHPLEPEWGLLAGTTTDGKTWVYAQDYPGSYHQGWISWPAYHFMTDAVDEDWALAWEKPWWNPHDGSNTPGYMNEMKFDLNGGPNFTFYETASSEGQKGKFILNTVDMTVEIIDSHIPDFDVNTDPDRAASGEYVIKVLNENELILWQDQREGSDPGVDYGWCWVFKRKGYNY